MSCGERRTAFGMPPTAATTPEADGISSSAKEHARFRNQKHTPRLTSGKPILHPSHAMTMSVRAQIQVNTRGQREQPRLVYKKAVFEAHRH